MSIQQKLLVVFVMCGLMAWSAQSFAEPIQLYLDTSSEAVIRVPLDIEILVLNENGEVETGFDGKHELHITVNESGMRDESYSVRANKVRFKKGKGFFSIEDSEGETLDVTVGLADSQASGQISLTFLDKDIFPPEITDIFEESSGVLKLEFNEEVEEESAQEERNYRAVTNKREAYPVKIEYHRTYVFLEFEEPFLTDEEGCLELEGIKDLDGNEVSSGLKSPDFEGTCEDACPD